MTTYVLVPGAWLGGWAWEPVTRRLQAQGHDVHPVTFTGLGERSHLASPEVDLDTYIADVVDLVESEDLHDVVLVGHSYAGHVVTAVADRIPERISLLAFLDAGPSPDGAAFMDLQPPAARQLIERLVEEAGEGWRIPLPTWEELEGVMGASLEGLGEEERDHLRARATAQPLRTWTQPLSLMNPARDGLPKLLISCSIPLDQVRQMIASGHPWFAALAGPEWSFLELPTGHSAHVLGPRRSGLAAARPLTRTAGPGELVELPVHAADLPTPARKPASTRLAQRGFAEDLVDAAKLAQAGLGLAADPAADRLHRDPELPGRGLLGQALALEHAREPLGEGAVLGPVAADRREGAAGAGRAAQDVDLDPVGEDAEADLDLAAVGAGRVQQGVEDGVVGGWLPSGLSGASRR